MMDKDITHTCMNICTLYKRAYLGRELIKPSACCGHSMSELWALHAHFVLIVTKLVIDYESSRYEFISPAFRFLVTLAPNTSRDSANA